MAAPRQRAGEVASSATGSPVRLRGGRTHRASGFLARGAGAIRAAELLALAGWRSFFHVRNSIGPLNQWPSGHLILALSSGSSHDSIKYRYSTSAGPPHLE